MCFYVPVLMTALYNGAKDAPCPLRLYVMLEAGWDVGCFALILIAIALAYLGAS
jgi:hypothetical protein